jgi:predicted nucleotide-binding protein
MAKINPGLLARLQQKLRIGPKQVYALIQRKVSETHLPRHLAAVALASERGIGISRFASDEDLAAIRQTSVGTHVNHSPSTVVVPAPARSREKKVLRQVQKRGKSVFVVHGRDEALRRSLFAFLRAIGLNPIEWRKAIALTKKPSPYIGEILEAAFQHAVAVVVLFSPDDEARLRSKFIKPIDGPHERELTPQPRPNVLFEAGMAFGRNPDRTVLVQVGDTRPFSDLAGRHVVHLSGSPESRQELATKLDSAGCSIDLSGTDWLREGDFDAGLAARSKRKR